MSREMRTGPDREPNWKLAFGSGAFLLVWILGNLARVPLDTVLTRAVIGGALGAALGAVVGMTLKGLRALANENEAKGQRVDFTVPADESELATATGEGEGEEATVVVPQAPEPAFQPIDYKSAAKHIQGLMSE
jgi:hypothetical protein